MRAFIYAFLPATLLLAAIWFTWQGLQAPPPEVVAAQKELPRYAVTGAEWTRLGVSGAPEFRARAAAIDYYADGSAQLRTIGIDALGGHESPWQLRAPAGEAPPRARRLLLTGGVQAEGRHPSGAPIQFATERLWVDLLRRELYTEAPVQLQTDFRSASARGLRADFRGERVQLLNDVRVDYAPEG